MADFLRQFLAAMGMGGSCLVRTQIYVLDSKMLQQVVEDWLVRFPNETVFRWLKQWRDGHTNS